MIQSHLSLLIGERFVGSLNSVVQISKLKLGKLYVASIMYGYFLKRMDERFQLERSMNTLPPRIDDPNPLWDMESMVQISPDEDGFSSKEGDDKSYRLRSYVLYLDADTLQRYATIRSKEVVSLMEKQTQASFGRPDVKNHGGWFVRYFEQRGGEYYAFGSLTILVLEAVAFGSFLWEAEGNVESMYHFVSS